MQTKNLIYILGLDIGMASAGAALLLPYEKRILGLHVRTFEKAETADGESLNKIRRESRLTRRRIRRRAFRLLRLARLMKRLGLITKATPEAFVTPGVSPWDLRATGLDRLLDQKEWAAVLYHLVKHRGFQSNRKSEAKADAKVGKMLSGVKGNHLLLANYRSVGELAVKDTAFGEAKRNKGGSYNHTFARNDLVMELNLLFEHQRSFQNPFAKPEFQAEVKNLLLARRPPLSGAALVDMVGLCTFEKGEKRAPKAGYHAERFVWLGKLNNLKIIGGGQYRALTDNERFNLIELPFVKAKLTFKQMREALKLEPQERFNLCSYTKKSKGADKDPESAAFFEAKFFHTIRKAYESAELQRQWERDKHNADKLDTLGYALTVYKEDSESREYLKSKGAEPDVIEAALEESFEKFINLSQKALVKILPFMEKGQRYDEAAKSAGYNHHQPTGNGERKSNLPAPDKDSIRNPVVYRALNQARKLVNAIVAEYGPPSAIHIELARDLSKPFDEREEIKKEQEKYREEKEKAVTGFIDLFGSAPKGPDIQKWRLFKEQLDQCPYCQQALDVNRLFTDSYSQIDHILPYSRSFDDSMNNKVVVHTKCNQDKRNLTPYEFLDGATESERWRGFAAWVQGNKSIRQAKKGRLLRVNFGKDEAGEFRDRNLNDTRWICREFKNMVETNLQWHPDSLGGERCVVLSGRFVALLRTRWGLLKSREEGDRHHALDAAVIAAASRGLVKRMSDYSRRRELEMVRGNYADPETGEIIDMRAIHQAEADFPKPWPHFREELLARLSDNPAQQLAGIEGYGPDVISGVRPVLVSRMPTRRSLGKAHKETTSSMPKDCFKDGKLSKAGESSVKTPVENLKLKDLKNIVGAEDPRNFEWINALRERLEPFEAEDSKTNKCAGAKAFAVGQPPLFKPSGEGKTAPKIRSVKLKTPEKSGIQIRNGLADNGDMVRADIFTKAGKFYAVPVYVADAVRPELPNRAATQGKMEEEWPVMDDSYKFIFSLYPNDYVIIRLKNEVRQGYYAGLNRATANIDLWLHDRNQKSGKNGKLEGNGIKTALAVEKCHVDILGNLYKAKPETRQKIHNLKRETMR